MRNMLNLLWRLIGGNILLVIIGVILVKSNIANAQYIVSINMMIATIVTLHIITRKLNISSKISDILSVYMVCAAVVNFFNIENEYQSIIASLCAIVSSVWIIKFLMVKKLKES